MPFSLSNHHHPHFLTPLPNPENRSFSAIQYYVVRNIAYCDTPLRH